MQDWERFGEEIRRTVQDAVDSQDYRKLNQTITDTINRAVNGAVNGAEQGMRSFGNAFDQATRNMGRGPGGPRGRYGQMGGADRWGRTPGGGVPPFGTYRWSGTDGNGRAWNPDMQDYKAESQGSSRYGYSNAQQSPVNRKWDDLKLFSRHSETEQRITKHLITLNISQRISAPSYPVIIFLTP